MASFASSPAAAAHGVLVAVEVLAAANGDPTEKYMPSEQNAFLKYVHHLTKIDFDTRKLLLDAPKSLNICVGSEDDVEEWMKRIRASCNIKRDNVAHSPTGQFAIGVVQSSVFRWIRATANDRDLLFRALDVCEIDNGASIHLQPVAALDKTNERALLDFSGWGALVTEKGVMIDVVGSCPIGDEKVLFWEEDGHRNVDMDNYIIEKAMNILQKKTHSRNHFVVSDVKLPQIQLSKSNEEDYAGISNVWMGHTQYYIHTIRQRATFSVNKTGGKSTSETIVIIEKEIPNEQELSFDFRKIAFGYAHVRILPTEEGEVVALLSAGIRRV